MRPAAILVGAMAITTLCGCGGGSGGGQSQPPAPASATGGNSIQRAALDHLNAMRSQAHVPAAAINDVLDVSATRHAGYQALRGAGLTHYESTDGSPDPTKADTTNALFTAVDLGGRIRAANGRRDLPDATLYYEDICSLGGPQGIDLLWNTVYHRVPMMRHAVRRFGFGDEAVARSTYPQAGVPAGDGYGTCDFADLATAITLSFWPADGQTAVPRSFDTQTESPDPVSATNGIQNPPTPDDDVVGTPIHLIAPVLTPWTAITATLTAAGGAAVPLYVLCGYPHDGIGGVPPAAGPGSAHADSYLDAGEIFLLPIDALAPRTGYTVAIDATAGTSHIVQSWSFTTGP